MRRQLRYTRVNSNSVQHKWASAHALAIYDLNAVYTFIPKNACSTMRYSLAIHNGFIRVGDDAKWIDNNNSTFVADQRSLVSNNYAFVVLRCPYRRLVSGYLDKVVSANLNMKYLLSRSPKKEDLDKISLADVLNLSFHDFARLCLSPRSGVIDFHWNPQISFLVYEDYDDWFSVEDFTAATEKLTEIGFHVHDTRNLIGHSTHRDVKIDGAFARTPAGQIAQMRREGKVPDYHALYDDETRALVKKLYADDLQLYRDKIGSEHLLFAD